MDKNHEGEESDDSAPTNPCQQFNIGCHDNGMESDYNCQSINNNTIPSYEYRKTKTDQQNRISVVKEGKTYYQDAMKKEKTLKRQFSIQAEHDYHGKYGSGGEEEGREGKRELEGDNSEEAPCDDNTSSVVANGTHTSDWESSKDVLDGELSKHLISYHLNVSEVGKQEDSESKIEDKDNEGTQINYNDAINNSDYRYFYNENNYKSGNYCNAEYYTTNFRTTKGDVMLNEKDIQLINDQKTYNYQDGGGSVSAEFSNGNELVSYLRQQPDDMFLMQDAFQNQVMPKNIDQVIADTFKNDNRTFTGYVNYQNGSSPKDEASSEDSSHETEKLESKILNLSHIKYSHSSRASGGVSGDSDHQSSSHIYDNPLTERMFVLGRATSSLVVSSKTTHENSSGNYEGPFSERISLLGTDELDFENSPSPNRDLQSLDSPPTSRSQGNILSLTTTTTNSTTPNVRFDNSSLHPSPSPSSSSVMHCLNSLTNPSSTSVLQVLSPQRDLQNPDCDDQVNIFPYHHHHWYHARHAHLSKT